MSVATPNLWALGDLATPWALHVVVTLRVAEHLDAAGGRSSITALATACRAHADSLHRVLRHLIAHGLFVEDAPGVIGLNEAGRALLDPGARLGFDLDGIGGRMAGAWSSLLEAVRGGEPAYHRVFGRPFWEDLQAHPDVSASFDALMGPAGHGAPDPEVLIDGDWTTVRTVVDVGGGTGALLLEILEAHPHLHGVLVDLPSTIARARSVFESAGALARVTLAPQSFFDPLPPGGDLYLLKNVLSDWSDRDARLLLARCADAARPAGRVVVVSGVSPDDTGGSAPELLMLVLVGGRGRTLSEFRELARSSGLEVARVEQRARRFLVECRPEGWASPAANS